MTRSGLGALLASALFFVGGASSAQAATRHVTPVGTGTACSLDEPCGLETGIELAADGDEVIIAAGEHAAATMLAEIIEFPASGSITVRGAVTGPGRPVITARTLVVRGADSLLQDVEFRGESLGNRARRGQRPGRPRPGEIGPGPVPGAVLGPARQQRLRANQRRDRAHLARRRRPQRDRRLAGRRDPEQRQQHRVGRELDRQGDDRRHPLRRPLLPGARPLRLRHHRGRLHREHHESGVVGHRLPGSAGRPAPGAGSSTIDAGTEAGIQPGELDLNGNLRIAGGGPDISAYEHVPAPEVDPGAVETTIDTATIRPVVATTGGRTTVTLRYGTAPDDLGNQVTVTVPAALEPQQVEFPLTGLAPLTTHLCTVRAGSDGGTVDSAPATFFTALPASASVAAPTDITQTTATLHGGWSTPAAHRGRSGSSLPPPAAGR